jgi:hypothetical protein
MIMATDFAPGGANKIPYAKEAADYTVPPRGGKVVLYLPLMSRARFTDVQERAGLFGYGLSR